MIRIAMLGLLLAASSVRADEPMPPPARTTTCSPSKTYCAVSDPASAKTTVSKRGAKQTLWTIDGWHRWIFVSDDGESIVVGYEGMNLVPRDVRMDEPVLRFYHRAKLVRSVRLRDLYRSKAQMQPTVSNYAWGYITGFNRANQLILELVDGKRIAYDPKTGAVERMRP
jgi:hypothetical protein